MAEIAEHFFSLYVRNFRDVSKDTRLLRKILNQPSNLPYPGELKNIIRTSLAFSDVDFQYDFYRRLYNNLIGNLELVDISQLHADGFTVREIEKLKGASKSTVSRKLTKED